MNREAETPTVTWMNVSGVPRGRGLEVLGEAFFPLRWVIGGGGIPWKIHRVMLVPHSPVGGVTAVQSDMKAWAGT